MKLPMKGFLHLCELNLDYNRSIHVELPLLEMGLVAARLIASKLGDCMETLIKQLS